MASTTAELDTFVETRNIDVDELHLYPGNARRGDIESLKASLKRHGQYRALIVQDRGPEGFRVLAGNHTFQALQALGRKQVRCEVHVMDDDLARRVNIADNRQSELGTNDEQALLALLAPMDGDFYGLGYSQDDVDAMLAPMLADPVVAPAPARPSARPDTPDVDDDDEDEDEDDDEPEEKPKGLGKPVISYQLVFDNEVQQGAWFEFLRSLRRRFPDLETNGERLHAYLGSVEQ